MSHPATIVRGSEQKPVWLATQLFRPLLGPDQTNGRFAIGHVGVRQGTGSPPHLHTREDEAFYILEGEMTFLFGDRMIVAKSGDFVWAPRGIPHNFTGTSEKPVRAIIMVTPTAFMDFAAGFTEPCTDADAWPDLTPKQIQSMLATAPGFGIEIFPPTYKMPTVTHAAPGASARRWVMGEHVSYLATAEQTGGQFTVVEVGTAPAGGPPPHVHVDGDEIMYVIAGRHEVTLDGRTEIAGPGDLVWVPRGCRHRYSNADASPGKLLSVHTPGGFEKFFNEAGVNADEHATAPQMPPPPPEVLAELLARHGMTV